MRHSNTTSGVTQNKVFVMYVEGDSATVQKAMETAQRTLSGPTASVRATITPTPPRVALPPADNGPLFATVAPQEEEEALPADVVQGPESAKPPRKPRVFRALDVLDDLKANEEPDSFKSFVGTRSFDADIERGLVAATWLKQKRAVNEFGKLHMNTCFSMVGWKMPDDPGSLLRQLKKRGLVRSIAGKKNLFEITSTGVNRYAEL